MFVVMFIKDVLVLYLLQSHIPTFGEQSQNLFKKNKGKNVLQGI